MSMYKPQEFAEMIGVSVKTLQRWDKESTWVAHRSPSNRRDYTHKHYVDDVGESQRGHTMIYTRVSTTHPKDDLVNPVEFLQQLAHARGMIVDQVFEDIGRGLNYHRKKWNTLIEDCLLGHISTIIISHKDRFIRFGYEWFERFLQNNGVEIIGVNNGTTSPEEEWVQDLISIIHVFSCRIYGLRKYKKKIVEDDDVAKSLQNRNSAIQKPSE